MPFLARDAVVRESADKTAILEAGRPVAIIVGKDTPGPRQGIENGQIRKAAEVLADYLHKISGVDATVVESAQKAPAGAHRIWVGAEADPLEAFPELRRADVQGFVITTKPADGQAELHLVGASGVGTQNAVWFFLMNYADVRNVLPGTIGEIVPHADHLDIPRDLYLLNPAPDYLLRTWSGNAGFNTAMWLADTRDSERLQYHHNCYQIFPPGELGATHPEYFPVKAGKPYVPPKDQTEGWQPTFSNPASAQRAIDYAGELFAKQPNLKSMSLTVNDGLGYSETDMKLGKLLPDGNISIADPYGRYVNAVAEGIEKRWPGKYVAFLPYNLTKWAPSFSLADNVIVFLFKEPNKAYEEWQGKTKHVGLYLWLYGMGYVIPNHWPHAMQDALRWTREHGGVAFKGEAYAAWMNDGPKMWVLNNLLWNTDLDVDALLRDYYEHAYGREAAPAVARYFAQAEKIYERHHTPEEYHFTALRPGEEQFSDVTAEDFQAMRAALDDAKRVVVGDGNRQRLDLLESTFHWAELYWQQYAVMQAMLQAQVHSDAEATKLLDSFAEFQRLGDQAAEHFEKQIKPHAELCVYAPAPDRIDFRADAQFKWAQLDAARDAACAAISKHLVEDNHLSPQDAAAWWDRLGHERAEVRPYAQTQRLALLHPGAALKNLLTNGSFEEPPATVADGKPQVARDWPIYQSRMVNATVTLDHHIHHGGNASLTAHGLTDASGTHRFITAQNHARYRLTFWYRTSPETQQIQSVVFLNKPVTTHYPPVDEWTRVQQDFILDKPGGDTTTFALNLTLRHGGSEKSQAWFDDVKLELLAPEGAE
ncbi:DUF4838 domain-containing protein [Chthoniobacter flavus]|nr:DUF4838 domain-containing protein [Chthoniobacter flavus]